MSRFVAFHTEIVVTIRANYIFRMDFNGSVCPLLLFKANSALIYFEKGRTSAIRTELETSICGDFHVFLIFENLQECFVGQ